MNVYIAKSKLVVGLAAAGSILSLFSSVVAVAQAQVPDSPAPDPQVLMDRSWHATLVNSATSKATFTMISTSGSQQVKKVSSYIKLQPGKTDNRRLTRFEYPSDAKGIATLLIDHTGAEDELWLYVPAAKKVRRVVASDKKSSFMGTDLSYGDVIGYRVQDWTHRVTGVDSVDGHACWKIESVPKTDTEKEDSGYSKRITCVDQNTFVALRIEASDLDGKASRMIWNRNIEPVSGQPGVFVAREIEARDIQSGHSTKIVVDEFKASSDVSDAAFSPRALEE